MATEISSIDEVLAAQGQNMHTPDAPEMQVEEVVEPESANTDKDILEEDAKKRLHQEEEQEEQSGQEEDSASQDEYGNKTEDLSESMRKRLQRQAESLQRRHEAEIAALKAQLTPQQTQEIQQAADNFQVDPNSADDWQKQLADFVKHTVQSMSVEQQQTQMRAKQQQQEAEFRARFQQGMDKFEDYVEVVATQPVTDAMVAATRGMNDPASFLYAASKRAPEELQRISQIQDPIKAMAETIRLEERLKKAKTVTNAPRALGRTPEDTTVKHSKTQSGEPTIEEMIAQAEARKLALRNAKMRK